MLREGVLIMMTYVLCLGKLFYFSALFESKYINKRLPQEDWEVFKSQSWGIQS